MYKPNLCSARKILDHGYVRYVDHMGNDLSIVRSARVSYNAAWRTGEDAGKDEKLIRYLLKNRHTTPFESVVFTFDVKAPIFVYRQWHRHRTQAYNEMSARYTELPEEFYIPKLEQIGIQSESSKQAREFFDITEADPLLIKDREKEINMYRYACTHAFRIYRKLLAAGWPRELARMVLPLSTYSVMFATVNLHNLFGYLSLRNHGHAQYEIRVYAQAMLELIEPLVPVAVTAYIEYGKNIPCDLDNLCEDCGRALLGAD